MTAGTIPEAPPSAPVRERPDVGHAGDLQTTIAEIRSRRPAVGLALAICRGGRCEVAGQGLADIGSNTPVTEDTIFRIASITKTVTAVAIMQLWERGLVDLDAPVNDYLRAFRVIDTAAGFGAVTVRHLLTHTSGIPDVLHLADLLHAGLTPNDGRPPGLSVEPGERLPSLAAYYGDGPRVVAEPGTAFAYCNHGFATLGQLIEDVTDLPLERYFRERIFEPLGMADAELVRSPRVAARLATGYVLGRGGARAVADREWIGPAAGGIYCTIRDLARYATALLGGGSNEHGSILDPATLATMFEPHYQPDPRLPGMGLAFFRGEVAGHRVVSHGGILPGFNTELIVAPDDDLAAIAITNGSPGAAGWLGVELERLLRRHLDVPENAVPRPVPQRPETWSELCGRYVLSPVADPRQRLLLGGGAEVVVSGGRLMMRILTPVPALYRGLPLEPADATDPSVFRVDLSHWGLPAVRVVFGRVVDGRATAVHTDLLGQPWSLLRASDHLAPGWVGPAAVAAGLGGMVTAVWRRRRGTESQSWQKSSAGRIPQ